jgi:hypothetical protein
MLSFYPAGIIVTSTSSSDIFFSRKLTPGLKFPEGTYFSTDI